MIKKVFMGLFALVLILLIVGFILPGTAHVERSIMVKANPSTVYHYLNSYNTFNEWSPWAELDPNAQYTFSGNPWGTGAKMSWTSEDKNVGSGSQEIMHSEPGIIKTKLDFGPQGVADAFFDITPDGEQTKIVWGFDTDFGMNPIGRFFGLMMDGMLGPQYEKGLANLKAKVEALPDTDISTVKAELVEVEAQDIAFLPSSSAIDSDAIGEAMGQAYGQIMATLGQNGIEVTGMPISITKTYDETVFEFDAAMPIAAAPENAPEGDVQFGKSYAGKALKVVHKGPYEGLEQAYEAFLAFAQIYGFEINGNSWDVFANDPTTVAPEEIETHMYIPVK